MSLRRRAQSNVPSMNAQIPLNRIPKILKSRTYGPLLAIVGLTLTIIILVSTKKSSTYFNTFSDNENFIPQDIIIHDQSLINTPYKKVFEKHTKFQSLSYHQKCETYFKELHQFENSWTLFTKKDIPYNKDIFSNKEKFIQERINRYKLEHLKNKQPDEQDKIIKDKNLYSVYQHDWAEACEEASEMEKRLINAMSHTRVYGACYLNEFGDYNLLHSDEENQDIDNQCNNIEHRGFPWLLRTFPQFKRWDGKISKYPPVINDYINNKINKNSKCFFKNFKEQINGQGIVTTGNDEHVSDLIRLIGNLRAIGNTLPIEIVYHGDLSKNVEQKLISIARNIDDIDVELIDNLAPILKERNIELVNKKKFPVEYKAQLEELFPPQELWFVDVNGIFEFRGKDKIIGSSHRLMAYLYNSFKDTILIEASTAIVSDLRILLNSKSYKETGTYFFRDRELEARNNGYNLGFIRKLVPSLIDTALFGIPQTIDYALSKRYFKGNFRTFMDPGLFAIDRSRYFSSILASIQMLLWEPPAKKIWENSELIWLGLIMTGHQYIYFNNLPAGSVGKITPIERRLIFDNDDERRNNLNSKEICSQHSGQVLDENNTLLWFNHGFSFCSNMKAAESDQFNSPYVRNLKENSNELRMLYKKNQEFDGIIIPKPQEYSISNDKGEPEKGWANINTCYNEFWCGYDNVGGEVSNESSGKLIEFEDSFIKRLSYFGSIYIQSEKLFDPRGKVLDVAANNRVKIN